MVVSFILLKTEKHTNRLRASKEPVSPFKHAQRKERVRRRTACGRMVDKDKPDQDKPDNDKLNQDKPDQDKLDKDMAIP